MASRLLSFPNPVNEVAARLVAAGVVTMSLLIVLLQWHWVLVPLAYGFIARALTGPTLSPLGQLVTRVIVPRLALPPKYVPGPPKRFAQCIGAVVSMGALVLAFGPPRSPVAATVAVGLLAIVASLEAILAYCVGCKVFALLMALHVIPDAVCLECKAIGQRTVSQG